MRVWLERHQAADELLIRCFKSHAKRRGLTYRQALDEALCHGWIDGVRHALDDDSFCVRFTPRRATSAWSRVNVARFGQLRRAGRVRPAGLAAFRNGRRSSYSFENRPRQLAPVFLERLEADRRAWPFFEAQPPWYRRVCAFWVMSAKRPQTRERRLQALIERCRQQRRVAPLETPGARATRRQESLP